MDEKTEDLRDIFTSVTDEESVTETQAETRGSLTDDPTGSLPSVVEGMRERYDFAAGLAEADYCEAARRFYDGDDDAALADALGTDEETARTARLDLHLYVDADFEVGADPGRVRDLLADADPGAVADELGIEAPAVERFAAADAARNRSLRANHRFRQQFDELLADSDLTRRLTPDVTEDGLEDATEGLETDTQL